MHSLPDVGLGLEAAGGKDSGRNMAALNLGRRGSHFRMEGWRREPGAGPRPAWGSWVTFTGRSASDLSLE